MIIEESNHGVTPAPSPTVPECEHLNTKEELVPQPGPHYKQLVCADCGVHIRYLARPENLARWRANSIKIEKLLALDMMLEPWEASFIQKISNFRNGKLSPRQQDVLEEVYQTHFQEESPSASEKGGEAR